MQVTKATKNHEVHDAFPPYHAFTMPLASTNKEPSSKLSETLMSVIISLYLIPYTLYLIPYTLYLIPYTLYLIPYTSYVEKQVVCDFSFHVSILFPFDVNFCLSWTNYSRFTSAKFIKTSSYQR